MGLTGMWGKGKESQTGAVGGDDFERAAARVSADLPAEGPGGVPQAEEGESLAIRPEWAEAAARLCFLPAAKFVHPAYALADEEAAAIGPQMQTFLQAVADKYAPAAVGRLANKYPEFFDLAAALGVLYWQKWRYVSHLQKLERARAAAERQQPQERAEAEAFAAAAVASGAGIPGVPVSVKVGEIDGEGFRVI